MNRTPRKLNRRAVLKGIGGFTLALPLLESLRPRKVRAANESAPPFAVFLRQANGVAAEQNTQEIGMEPERFWPTQLGALTPDTVAGRALDELVEYLDRMLVVRNVNMY
ncbi:MAG: transcriptional initiation protein Tat, partial [Myxococcales bacterium]|nr:transcriptional initiation protein Tat [Myxococcales bacterium]